MKKGISVSVCLAVLILLCAVPTQAWQGRIAGMGGVYGLVEDESDFLIHPAGIANGKGFNFYGNLQIGMQTTNKNDFSMGGGPADDWWRTDYEAHGREFQYGGLAGAAFPVGPGRMGIFLQYTGIDGKLKGDKIESEIGYDPYSTPFDSKNRLDNLALRLLYGIPLNKDMRLGAEFQIGYKKDRFANYQIIDWAGGYENELFSGNLFVYGIPYDSEYYEASMKASLETMLGPAKASFTLRGGVPFNSDNHLRYSNQERWNYGEMSGKVEGYSLGGDAWVRLPLNSSLSLPFVLSVDYKSLKRDGDGWHVNDPWTFTADHNLKTKSLSITTGGGIDYVPAQGTRVAGGLYYSYLKSKTDFFWTLQYTGAPQPPEIWDWDGIPKTTEHTVSFKGSVEKALSSDVSLTGGFSAFYGLVKQEGNSSYTYDSEDSSISSAKGKQWGVGASFGAAIKAGDTMVEPYISGGFKKLKLSGDAAYFEDGGLEETVPNLSLKKDTWFIGGGLALRF